MYKSIEKYHNQEELNCYVNSIQNCSSRLWIAMKIFTVIFNVPDSVLHTTNTVNNNIELYSKSSMSFKHVDTFVKEKSNNCSLFAFHLGSEKTNR